MSDGDYLHTSAISLTWPLGRSRRKCPVCGKVFYKTADWVYKAYANGGHYTLCSYSCTTEMIRRQKNRRTHD